MDRFESYFKFNKKDVLTYIKEKTDYFDLDDSLYVEEIGDGNINYIYRVYNRENKSIIIKQADRLLRSSQRPLDMDRNRIEAEALQEFYNLSSGRTPKVYRYDDRMNCIVMEDISHYQNLRLGLLNKEIYPNMAEDISSFLVESLLPNTDLVLDPKEKKAKQARYINEDMCQISENLVFTEPFNDYRGRNIILDENLGFVRQELYEDRDLALEAAKLKNTYKNYSQSLIHGDLHSGSIFIDKQAIKVIDPEFAFYGPIGYDVGTILANLFFSLVNSYIVDGNGDGNKTFNRWLENSIKDMVDLFKEKFKALYKELVEDPLAKSEAFMDFYLGDILAYSSGLTGLEMIRRTVGDSKVEEISSIASIEDRIKLERVLILMGKDFIKHRDKISSGVDYLDIFYRHII